MIFDDKNLKSDEKAIFALRSLYGKYGYSRYKMNKFEEYDLYVRNKDFLISDSVITFTDTNGKLMALKPDVTLSIIKNCTDEAGVVQKMYYDENVYRVSKGRLGFREITQVGLECIGDIDDYCVFETLFLAAESLMTISEEWVLDISHLGILTEAIEKINPDRDTMREIIKCVSEKNPHELRRILGDEAGELLIKLVTTYGDAREVLCELKKLDISEQYLDELESVVSSFEMCGLAKKLRIDFSVVSDIKYYNGITFKGFINGIPEAVLTGGRYDNLMKRMGKKAGAIGFAVYIDLLEEIEKESAKYDVDTLLIYEEGEPQKNIIFAVTRLSEAGKAVVAQRAVPEKLRYKKLMKLKDGEVTCLEDNA